MRVPSTFFFFVLNAAHKEKGGRKVLSSINSSCWLLLFISRDLCFTSNPSLVKNFRCHYADCIIMLASTTNKNRKFHDACWLKMRDLRRIMRRKIDSATSKALVELNLCSIHNFICIFMCMATSGGDGNQNYAWFKSHHLHIKQDASEVLPAVRHAQFVPPLVAKEARLQVAMMLTHYLIPPSTLFLLLRLSMRSGLRNDAGGRKGLSIWVRNRKKRKKSSSLLSCTEQHECCIRDSKIKAN